MNRISQETSVRPSVAFSLDPDAFFLTDRRLDFSLVAVAPNRTAGRDPKEWGWSRISEKDGLVVKGEYVSIIQHPKGEPKQIAMRENQVVDLREDFTWYHTDTAPGSSGSPVFNDQWELVALHHSGVPKRDNNGNILTTDDLAWKDWMGDHRIKWIANEGASIVRIAALIKKASGLSMAQKKLRDELFDGPGSRNLSLVALQLAAASGLSGSGRTTDEVGGQLQTGPTSQTDSGATRPTSLVSASIEIPIRLTISIDPAAAVTATGKAAATIPAAPQVVNGDPAPPSALNSPAESDDLRQALADVEANRQRQYFHAEQDRQDKEAYYGGLSVDSHSRDELFLKLSELVKSTHTKTPKYRPTTYVYPWVDLHPDRQLRSIYSGKGFSPEEIIREDFRIQQERMVQIEEFIRNEAGLGSEQLRELISQLETQNPFNCEHVIPQSWFGEVEPMRGDLHHLFTCESGCNSFRSNIAYFDFSEIEEAERTDCGRRLGNKFEPSSGKGAVARATLYFLLRYPGKINSPAEFPQDRVSMLLQWHHDNPVDQYEQHRNQAIFELQGNRNPLIDYPAWAGKIAFEKGIS